jgi:DNA-binding CsgD family transcriptional regulator
LPITCPEPTAAASAADGATPGPAFELLCRRLQVVCVDGVTPRQRPGPGNGRVRLEYHEGELAHFELAGSRFALVASEPVPERVEDNGRDPRLLLTSRELQIVQLICMGLLTKQVADRLHLSEFTVRSYLKTIYCKLGVRSRGGMVYTYARAFGLAVPLTLRARDEP